MQAIEMVGAIIILPRLASGAPLREEFLGIFNPPDESKPMRKQQPVSKAR